MKLGYRKGREMKYVVAFLVLFPQCLWATDNGCGLGIKEAVNQSLFRDRTTALAVCKSLAEQLDGSDFAITSYSRTVGDRLPNISGRAKVYGREIQFQFKKDGTIRKFTCHASFEDAKSDMDLTSCEMEGGNGKLSDYFKDLEVPEVQDTERTQPVVVKTKKFRPLVLGKGNAIILKDIILKRSGPDGSPLGHR